MSNGILNPLVLFKTLCCGDSFESFSQDDSDEYTQHRVWCMILGYCYCISKLGFSLLSASLNDLVTSIVSFSHNVCWPADKNDLVFEAYLFCHLQMISIWAKSKISSLIYRIDHEVNSSLLLFIASDQMPFPGPTSIFQTTRTSQTSEINLMGMFLWTQKVRQYWIIHALK